MPTVTNPKVGQLDHILFDLPEPERTHALEEFLDPMNFELVKLKCSEGTFVTTLYGKTWTCPPAGNKVARPIAMELLLSYGRGGKYFGKHQETMHTEASLAALEMSDPAVYQRLVSKGVKIENRYLYDATEIPDEAED